MPSFSPSEPISFNELLRTLRSFQGLLALLCGYAIGFDEIRCAYLRPLCIGKPTPLAPIEVELIPKMTGYQHAFRRTDFSSMIVAYPELSAELPHSLTTA